MYVMTRIILPEKLKEKKAAGKKITEDLEFLRKEFYYFHGIKFAYFY